MSHQDPYASTGLSLAEADDKSFVNVAENDRPGGVMELPKEDDGSLLLSTVTGQFPNAVGLKYKGSSGAWRGIRISGNVLDSPAGGWGNTLYYVTLQKSVGKRKMEDTTDTDIKDVKLKKRENKLLGDVIVLGLPFKCTNEQLKEYFTNECGELAFNEVKFDRNTGKPRGFGFIRFKTIEGAEKALNKKHTMMGRTLEIRLSKKKEVPLKLFVGRIPNGVSQEELKTHFSEFGEVSDVFMPSPMRGFAFVTFESSEEGSLAIRRDHKIQGARLNVVIADPQGDPKRSNGGDARDEKWGSGNQREDGGLGESGYSTRLHGRQDERGGDVRGFWDTGADKRPWGLRDRGVPREPRDSRVPRDSRAREPRDDRLPREPRDNRVPREPRAREPRDHRVPREPRNSRGPRETRADRLPARDPRNDRPHRDSRDDRYQQDGDNRGPRDFRDPVERNPMAKNLVERRNLEVGLKNHELGMASLTRAGGERNRHEKGVEQDFRELIQRNRTERLQSARDPRDGVKVESRENNVGRVEMDHNRDSGYREDRRRNSDEVTGSRGMVDQRHPHGQYQLPNQFTQDNKFNSHSQHMHPSPQLPLPRVTPELAVRLKDMIYKFLGTGN